MVNKWLKSVQYWCFPSVCALCGGKAEDDLDLCPGCHADLPWLSASCVRCASPLSIEGICGQCLNKPPHFRRAYSPFQYTQPVDVLIQRLKFNNNLAIAHLLGVLMARHLSGKYSVANDSNKLGLPEMIVPVPLTPSRLRQRGYNQAIELARPVATYFGIPIDYDHCIRVRETAPQTELSAAERRKNIRGAFDVKGDFSVRHVAVVDDVMTTGSTVNELARGLCKAGVEKVDIWVCARASMTGF